MERCGHKPRDGRGPQKLREAGRSLPQSLRTEPGPAHPVISDFWSLQTVREETSVVFSPPACGDITARPCSLEVVDECPSCQSLFTGSVPSGH